MKAFAERHPNLTTWFVLALGMLMVLAWSARDVELTARQFFWLGVATVLLAGLCAWIISWEADEPEAEGEVDEDRQPGTDESDAAARTPVGASCDAASRTLADASPEAALGGGAEVLESDAPAAQDRADPRSFGSA